MSEPAGETLLLTPALPDVGGVKVSLADSLASLDIPNSLGQLNLELRDNRTQQVCHSWTYSLIEDDEPDSKNDWSQRVWACLLTQAHTSGVYYLGLDKSEVELASVMLPMAANMQLAISYDQTPANVSKLPERCSDQLVAQTDRLLIEMISLVNVHVRGERRSRFDEKIDQLSAIRFWNGEVIEELDKILQLEHRAPAKVDSMDDVNAWERNDRKIINLKDGLILNKTSLVTLRKQLYSSTVLRDVLIANPTSLNSLLFDRLSLQYNSDLDVSLFCLEIADKEFKIGRRECTDSFVSVQLIDANKISLNFCLQILPAMAAKGVRFTSCLPLKPLLGSPSLGIGLYFPEGVEASGDLAWSGYVSGDGIWFNSQIVKVLAPIEPTPFIPSDSLCADNYNTLGSEVYDVGGAVENGVDPRTGLFHAHYPIAALQGCEGKGPHIDLTLHYSAVRANEGALGDGWALRFSSFNNRTRMLSLESGQTVQLSSQEILDLCKDAEKIVDKNICKITAGIASKDGVLKSLVVILPSGRREQLERPQKNDDIQPGKAYTAEISKKYDAIIDNCQRQLDSLHALQKKTQNINLATTGVLAILGPIGWGLIWSGVTRQEQPIDVGNRLEKALAAAKASQKDATREPFILVPSSITSAQGGKLTLSWQGLKGHVLLTNISDGEQKLLTGEHGSALAKGTYSSIFTVLPKTSDSYQVRLEIQNALLKKLTRTRTVLDVSAPVIDQCVQFGYRADPALDRVLCSVAEEDGSLEEVSYTSRQLRSYFNTAVVLPQVLRHTLAPGAGQTTINHFWSWAGNNDYLAIEKSAYSSTVLLDSGAPLSIPTNEFNNYRNFSRERDNYNRAGLGQKPFGMQSPLDPFPDPFTKRTWTVQNGLHLLTEHIEEVPSVSRTTVTHLYLAPLKGAADTNAGQRLSAMPSSTETLFEDLALVTESK